MSKNKLLFFVFFVLHLLVPDRITAQQQFTMEHFIGVNLRREDPVKYTNCAGFVRDYHDWSIDEGNYYSTNSSPSAEYPDNKYRWNPGYQGQSSEQFDAFYSKLKNAMFPSNPPTIAPICASMKGALPSMAGGDDFLTFLEFKPVKTNKFKRTKPASWENPFNNPTFDVMPVNSGGTPDWNALTAPASYRWYADWVYQFTKRYGTNTSTTNQKLASGEPAGAGLNRVGYVEIWNEQDKWWIGGSSPAAACNSTTSNWLRMTKFCPDEYAAMASTVFDGHNGGTGGTVSGQNGTNGPTYALGVKNADANMRYVFGGLSEIDDNCWNFVTSVNTWCNTNRPAGADRFPFKVLNFHHYSDSKWDGLRGDGGGGVAPELDTWSGKTFRQRMAEISVLRDTNFPGKELWLSEFGYDTNEGSPLRVPVIGSNDRQEVQGQWLVRSYLETAYAGWDRAMQFCIRDNDSYYKGTVTFQSSGLVLDKANNFAPKKSYYYVAGMREALRGTKYDGDESTASVRVYRFKNTTTNQYVYAIWSPTASNTKVTTFTFTPAAVSATSATLVELSAGDFDGKKYSSVDQSTVVSVSAGAVSIKGSRVSERPVFVKINVNENEAAVPFCTSAAPTASGVSCDAIKVTWNAFTANSYLVYYYEKNDSEETGAPVFNIADPALKLYTDNLPGSSTGVLVSGLNITDDKYYIYIRAVVIEANGTQRVSDPCLVGGTSSTLSCSLNNIAPASVTTNPVEPQTTAVKMFDYNYLTPCNPARDQYNTDLVADGWTETIPGVGLDANEVTVTFSPAQNIESVQLLDGGGTGMVEFFFNGQTTAAISYLLDGYGVWKTFPYIQNSVTSVKIKRTKISEVPTINRIIFKGKATSGGSYATACCAGGAGYITVGTSPTSNTTLSSLISSSILPSTGTATDKNIIVNGTLTIDPGSSINNTYTFERTRFYMQSGAKISVQNQKTLKLTAKTALEGCTQMWNSVEMQAGSKLNMDEATIRDAWRGVNVLRTTTTLASPTLLTLNKSIFEKNYFGVYIASNSITSDFSTLSSINKSIFDGNLSDMKPCYSGQTNCAARANTGIYVHSATLNLGFASDETVPVQFKDLYYSGIQSFSTALSVRNTLIDKINGEDNGSYGIYQSGGTLDQQGFGFAADKKVSFRRMWYPIYVTQANFNIRQNRMEPDSWGIWAYKNGTTIGDITDNYIDNKITGIRIEDFSAQGVRIKRNTIFGNKAYPDDGIYCATYNPAANYTLEIGSDLDTDMNYITNQKGVTGTSATAAGIRLYNVKNAVIKRNKIDFTQYAQNIPTYGVYLSGGSGNIVNKNKFIGIANSDGQYIYSPAGYGVYAVNSAGNVLSCNLSDGCRYGLTFEGSCAQMNGVSGNQINKYDVGLQVLANSIIGSQNNTANRWEIIDTLKRDKAAKNLSSNLSGSVFTVKKSTTQIDPQTYFQGLDIISAVSPSTGWFVRDPAGSVPSACAPLAQKPGNTATMAEFGGDPTLESLKEMRLLNLLNPEGTFRQLAEGKLNSSGLSAATLWVMKRQALREIEELLGENPADGLLNAFVQGQKNTSVSDFHAIDKAVQALQKGNVLKADRMEELAEKIKLYAEKISSESEKWQLLPFEEQAALDHKRNQAGIDRTYHEALAEYNALFDEKDNAAKIEAKQLKNKNAAMKAVALYERHEQTVNELYIQAALEGNKLTEAQAQKLKEIAALCPDVAGEASQKARIVYGFYDPRPLPQWGPCGQAQKSEAVEERATGQLPLQVVVYPVPAYAHLMLSGAYDTEKVRLYQVVNLLGEVLHQGKVTDNVQQVQIGAFPSGMYYLRILEDGHLVAVKKFNIHH